MKKLSAERDNGKPIIFLDAFTFMPGVGPSSDMDGHDLSSYTYSEEQRRDDFIDAFNDNYADVAEEISFMGMPMIRVKAFYEDEILGDEEEVNTAEDDVEIEQNKEDLLKATLQFWNDTFDLTDAEKEKFLAEYKKKINY
jgi:hypothetical protein